MRRVQRDCLLVWLTTGCLFAQTAAAPPPPAPDAPPLVLKSTTRLVQISVVVHDKKGQPIDDLKKEDFTITEKGKPQEVAVFSMEDSRKAGPPPPKLAAGWFSNDLGRRQAAPNAVTVMLIDALNTKVADQTFARNQVLKFLSSVQPQDRVAIYLLGTSLRVLHDFTSDSASLVAMMKKFRGEATPENTPAPDPSDNPTGDEQMDAFLQHGFDAEMDFRTVNRALTTCAALEAIANHLQKVAGRKNLLWISGSFPLQLNMDTMSLQDPARDRRNFGPETERAVRALNQANLAIYPVDARGLVTSRSLDAAMRGNTSRRPSNAPPKLDAPDQDTLLMLADRTGGRAFLNTNDLAGALRTAIHDGEVSYVLGYYPANDNMDGRFRDIKVKVDRGGVDVRYRRGYFALKEEPRTDAEIKDLIGDALWSPLEATGIGLTGGSVLDSKNPNALDIIVRIDPKNVRLDFQKERWTGKLVIVYLLLDKDQKQLAGQQKVIDLAFPQARYDEAMKNGMSILEALPRNPAAAQVRVALFDSNTGQVGSLRFPILQP